IPTKNQTAEFACVLSSGVMCPTPPEIEPRPSVSGSVSASIAKRFPLRVGTEIERFAIHLHVIDPNIRACVPCFRKREQAEMRESEALTAMLRSNFGARYVTIEHQRGYAIPFG